MGMQVSLRTVLYTVIIMTAAGFILGTDSFAVAKKTPDAGPVLPSTVESIFVSLDLEAVDVPVARSGNGGALASFGDDLIVMTHEGGFFDVTGDTAIRLDVTPPPNGWDAMLAFEQANPDYSFAHYYFRFNDIAFFDGLMIVSYTDWVPEQNCYRNSIATAPLGTAQSAAEIRLETQDWQVLFSTTPCLQPKRTGQAIEGHMAGGRFRISEDRTIYLASGDYAIDGNYDPRVLAQDPGQFYGKVIAIDLDTGAFEIASQGHSNPQGIAITDTGDIYVVEHGRRGGDELNRIIAGTDYGWPLVSLGTRYNKLPLQGAISYGGHPEFQPPVYAWLPSVAPSSLMQIQDFHPAWDGDLLAGTLAGDTLLRIRIVDGRVLFDERIKMDMRIRHVHQHGDQIVLWTDQKQVVKLSVGQFDASAQFAVAKIDELALTDRQKAQTEAVLGRCAECHSMGVVEGGNAPALGQVYSRQIAGGDFDYSAALRGIDGTWTRETLTAYLSDPDAFAPGTGMPNPEISDPQVVSALIDILEALRLQPE